jgi:hypothetical protein
MSYNPHKDDDGLFIKKNKKIKNLMLRTTEQIRFPSLSSWFLCELGSINPQWPHSSKVYDRQPLKIVYAVKHVCERDKPDKRHTIIHT